MGTPKEFVAGDTVNWQTTVTGYNSAEWTLTYYFSNETADFSVVGVADAGGGWKFSIPAIVSQTYKPGGYRWQIVLSQGENETLKRYTAATGYIVVYHNPAIGTGTGVDSRSQVKTALDAIDAVLAKSATKEQASYSINGRALERRKTEDLLQLRAHYARLYARELQEKKISKGIGSKRVYTRFL